MLSQMLNGRLCDIATCTLSFSRKPQAPEPVQGKEVANPESRGEPSSPLHGCTGLWVSWIRHSFREKII